MNNPVHPSAWTNQGTRFMNRLKLAIVAVGALVVGTSLGTGASQAQPFVFEGHSYCWYDDGWRGPGWIRCGFQLRRGLGWGGPTGWHGWGGAAEFRERSRTTGRGGGEIRERRGTTGRGGGEIRERSGTTERSGGEIRERSGTTGRGGGEMRQQGGTTGRGGGEMRQQGGASRGGGSEMRQQGGGSRGGGNVNAPMGGGDARGGATRENR